MPAKDIVGVQKYAVGPKSLPESRIAQGARQKSP